MSRTAFAGLFLVALGGCASARPTTPLCEYRPGDAPTSAAAPRTGVYSLYHEDDSGTALRVEVPVQRGLAVGFAQGGEGKPVAVAGSQTFALAEGGRHHWVSDKPLGADDHSWRGRLARLSPAG